MTRRLFQKKSEHSGFPWKSAGVRRIMHLCRASGPAFVDMAGNGPGNTTHRRVFPGATRRAGRVWAVAELANALSGCGMPYRPFGRVQGGGVGQVAPYWGHAAHRALQCHLACSPCPSGRSAATRPTWRCSSGSSSTVTMRHYFRSHYPPACCGNAARTLAQ